MTDMADTLDSRIRSCRELVGVFEREKDLLNGDKPPEARQVLEMLKRKLRLAETVAGHQGALNAAAPEAGGMAPPSAEKLRELGCLLERLLVLERENQHLLRKALQKAQAEAGEPDPEPVYGRCPLPSVQRMRS